MKKRGFNKLIRGEFMMKHLRKIILFSLVCIVSLYLNISIAYADAAADYGFDFMETFNNLPDWRGTGYGVVYYDGPGNNWDYYSIWGSIDQTVDWIANHGLQNVWQSTGKSLRMQLDYFPAKGPSRFGRYFGTGTPNSGYDEVYIFWMNKFPSNYFPKKSDGNYVYWSYYKFGAIMTGFERIDQYDSNVSGLNNQGQVYGRDFIIPLIRVWNYGAPCPQSSDIRLIMDFYWDLSNHAEEWTNGCLSNYLNSWFGIEYYIKSGTPGQANGHVTVWLYDAQGNATTVFDQDRMMLPAEHNYKWNKFWFGGNKSWSDSDYPNLSPNYYVDDFIINSSRIGPKYFAKKLGTSGDVNGDGTVDILDLQLCVNVFLGTETTPEYVQRAKEVAEPKDECNVLDVQAIVNIILGL